MAAARGSAQKNMRLVPAAPKTTNSHMATLRTLRLWLYLPRARASLTSLLTARGSPAVEMDRRTE